MANPAATSLAVRLWTDYRKHRYLLLLLVPGLIWYAVFVYSPMYGVQIAFKDYHALEGINGSPWAGLKHFRYLLHASPDIRQVFRNTVIISFYHIVFGFPAPIALALLFNEVRSRVFKRVAQSISYLPHFLSWVVLGGLLITILSPSTGIVNTLLVALGLEPIYFMASEAYFRSVLVVSAVWKEIGWGTVIYLAAIAGVDPHLYEAAVVDGAGRWRQVFHITLPTIVPVVAIMFLLRLGNLLDAGFDQILNTYNPAVFRVSDIIDTYVYRVGLSQMEYSLTTAVNLFKNVIALALVLLANVAIKKSGEEGLI
ncbi:MAG: sugar ABC transporter permease [Paenibacillaceae bacterium]|nr:sugar ABC transporter permease [Paenibacillaceae bacterium]